ncbi:hypothetical protein BDL97_02G150900 [Sphagnum fallax]|uniref:Uncharacterized protein n=1 Tax=Sphagnum jensenii TaxID=128206 RepID=A0ABP0WTR6_9BRYO|nr:hypothetical protein BDL97_02G150900 [Sphagnum fallax]
MAGFQREVASRTRFVCLVAELFPFLESADVLNQEREQEMAPQAPVLKPNKTGKAALPLKLDRTRSKRYLDIQKLHAKKQEYDSDTALQLVKDTASLNFVETVEAHF